VTVSVSYECGQIETCTQCFMWVVAEALWTTNITDTHRDLH